MSEPQNSNRHSADSNRTEAHVPAQAKSIRLLITDVDGVLSDGKIYYGNSSEELKSFSVKDGLGIKMLQKHGVAVAIITGRQSAIVERRAGELGIDHLYQGQSDKIAAFENLLDKLQLKPSQVAHIGDDLPDLPLMSRSALGIAVADAHWFVREQADWTTSTIGGAGAVREVTDMLLTSRGLLADIHKDYLA